MAGLQKERGRHWYQLEAVGVIGCFFLSLFRGVTQIMPLCCIIAPTSREFRGI